MAKRLPDRIRMVIKGTDVVGSRVAYHLTKLGWKNVPQLERQPLVSGSTGHATGGRAVIRGALDNSIGFIGRDALLRQRRKGLDHRLVIFTLDDPNALLWKDGDIFHDGVPVTEKSPAPSDTPGAGRTA